MYSEAYIDEYSYNNYRIDVPLWDLNEKDKELLDIAIYMLDYKSSLRKLSKEFEISKSAIHNKLTNKLRKISIELYDCCRKQMRINKKKYFKEV